ncbi:MAG: glutathione S-transferase family protein [Rhizobiales bacterium]|nr:glutathione S-transferase family protein [Hyphomicrobiales bacterium]MBO6697431.1 glutathione S-transferase family protein [Hyphomicrobiales bacterium]MBO6736314.1 glutathione S-transferase family protein [Hyphomicrobiales bacterium]MBO6912784.1 glutathione S-transferase family protein [Hyphomicrobiales bacterium]MBO6953952.1 glutathione S-transferase family protein [Hyphomicrobiales bacterium]
MAILRSAAASPFVRKCSIAAIVLGLEGEIESQPANTADPLDPLRQQNPLGKIPTLILKNGETLYDSRVIVAYLDQMAGGNKLYPVDPEQRIAAMRLEALADGIMDAAILQVYEKRYREEHERSHSWVERQSERVAAALSHLEAKPPQTTGAPTVGTIALACALGYLDLRFEGAWRRNYPALVAWLEAFRATVPAYDATAPAS